MYNKNKQNQSLVYNSQHSFEKFKDFDEYIEDIDELSLDSMYKSLNDFKKRFNRLKTINLRTDKSKVLMPEVLDNWRFF